MSDVEAQTFVRAAQARLDFQRSQAQIRIDDVSWVFGFVRGAPYPLGDIVDEESKSARPVTQHKQVGGRG
jgi:hypothetical protein